MTALFAQARTDYHTALLSHVLFTDSRGIPTNADSSNRASIAIAQGIMRELQSETRHRLAGQTSGNHFEEVNARFIKETFAMLGHIRPGQWDVRRIGNNNRMELSKYEQYAHLKALDRAAKNDPELAAALGNDYTITPDIVIIRQLENDATLNASAELVDLRIARRAALREVNGGHPLLHASISSKWTIRSDRAQNSRSEALNLIRNRKGHLPHVMVITAEPLPSRLASIALGTGDIDCVYHFALDELKHSLESQDFDDALELFNIMVNGKRLKDISDLPLDLAV